MHEMMKPLATRSKHKKTLLIIMTVSFAILALLYLNSFLQDQIKTSLTYFVLMMILMAFSGWQLIQLNRKPEVMAEYDKETLYLYTQKGKVEIPWVQLEYAKRKGHQNRIGNVQYGEIIFHTTDQKEYVLKDVGDPDDVILTIKNMLNQTDIK